MRTLTLFVSLFVLAAAAPVHSRIEVTAPSAAGKTSLEFKTIPIGEMVINEDAPWQLKIKEVGAFTLTKKDFSRADFDAKLPGFKIAGVTKESKPGSRPLEYQLTAFVCTTDKSRCYREVHQGHFQ